MKRFLALLFSVMILFSYVFAVEESDLDSDFYYESEPVVDLPFDGDSSVVGSGGGGGDVYVEMPEIYVMGSDIPADATITDISVMSLAPITPSDTSGLKSVLLSLIGDYDPVIIEYEYESSNGYTNYLREVQPDYVWLCSVGLFAIMVYCVFRLGGALIRD